MTATRAREWKEARVRTRIAASVAEDAAVDAEESAVDGEPDYVADAVDAAFSALEEAITSAEEALGETVVADVAAPRPSSDAELETLAARYATLADAIHQAVCAVDDGTDGVANVRAAVAAARRVMS